MPRKDKIDFVGHRYSNHLWLVVQIQHPVNISIEDNIEAQIARSQRLPFHPYRWKTNKNQKKTWKSKQQFSKMNKLVNAVKVSAKIYKVIQQENYESDQ